MLNGVKQNGLPFCLPTNLGLGSDFDLIQEKRECGVQVKPWRGADKVMDSMRWNHFAPRLFERSHEPTALQ